MGTVDAPGRGVAHHRVRRASSGPGVLRSGRRGQRRSRPTLRGASDLRSSHPQGHQGHLPDPGHDPRGGRLRGHQLPGLQGQAVLERRPGAAYRDRGELARRSRRQTPPGQPRRAPGQSPRGRRPAARHPESRPGLCHLGPPVRAGRTAHTSRRATGLRAALRGPPRHGPGRQPLRARAHRRRLHQQERLRPGEIAARRSLHEHADHLRPTTPPPQRPHPPHRRPEPLRPHIRRNPGRRVLHQGPPAPARTLLEAHKPPAPPELRRALRTIDTTINNYVAHARIPPAA